ncbi:MAG: hypothetical protein BAJATHORv1_20122 [Candidatus Thorarchaeota archaeon]|nr:MAG: hypothetical protein BAJATHORv1_20122 [Candidatus Thorarchaeota archaeon]
MNMSMDSIRDESSTGETIKMIERMGRTISAENLGEFESFLTKHLSTCTIDISDWPSPSVKSLLLVSGKCGVRIQMIRDGIRLAPIALPKGPMLDMFVQAIIDGTL